MKSNTTSPGSSHQELTEPEDSMTTLKLPSHTGCDLIVRCSKQWQELDVTDEDGIRFCPNCQKLVFLTRTTAELRLAAERGWCVFIVPGSSAQTEQSRIENMEPSLLRERIRRIETEFLVRMNDQPLGFPIFR